MLFKSFNILLILIGFFSSLVFNNTFIFSDEYIVPKRVWMYWEGQFDDMVKFCLHSIKQNLTNYEIILLNNNTIRCYLNSTDIPPVLYTLKQANQGDFNRFQLLSQYGGIWMDASSYVKNDEVFDGLIEEMNEKKADMLAFNFIYEPLNNIELGIILSSWKSEFIKKVNDIYVYGMKTGRKPLMKKMMDEGMFLKASNQYTIDETTGEPFRNPYFYSYYCVQYVLQILYKYSANIIVKRAEDWSFKFQGDHGWNGESMKKKLLEKNGLENYKLIKFTGENRYNMNFKYTTEVI